MAHQTTGFSRSPLQCYMWHIGQLGFPGPHCSVNHYTQSCSHNGVSVSKAKVKHDQAWSVTMLMDALLFHARLCTHHEISPESNSVQTLQKLFRCNLRSPICIRMQKDHIRKLKILQPMPEFGGLCKHQNNPACTKSVKSLQNV